MDRKDLMKKLISINEISLSLGRIKRHVVLYNGLPVLISDDALTSGINLSYISTRDDVYLGLPEELLSMEMKRVIEKRKPLNTITVIKQADSQ